MDGQSAHHTSSMFFWAMQSEKESPIISM
jgi:hypothetical protein